VLTRMTSGPNQFFAFHGMGAAQVDDDLGALHWHKHYHWLLAMALALALAC
jgi:hypothetical protein